MNTGAVPPPASETAERVWIWLRANWQWLALAGVVVIGVVVLLSRKPEPVPARTAPSAAAPDAPGAPSAAEASAAPERPGSPAAHGDAGAAKSAAAAAALDAGAPPSPNVRIEFKVYPGRRASVTWGERRLGFIDRGKPLVVERPRDSGPMDVVIRAPGFVPVHTRAYTFDDAVIDVRITPLDKKDKIYGYQQPLPPEGDAGAPL